MTPRGWRTVALLALSGTAAWLLPAGTAHAEQTKTVTVATSAPFSTRCVFDSGTEVPALATTPPTGASTIAGTQWIQSNSRVLGFTTEYCRDFRQSFSIQRDPAQVGPVTLKVEVFGTRAHTIKLNGTQIGATGPGTTGTPPSYTLSPANVGVSNTIDITSTGQQPQFDQIDFRVTLSYPIDTTAPTVTGSTTPPQDSGWYTTAPTIHWNVVDPSPSSGVATSPADTVADVEGEHTYVSDPACDFAGNCATGSLTLKVDTVAPVGTIDDAPVTLATPVSSTPVTGTATDATSGVASVDVTFTDATDVSEARTAAFDAGIWTVDPPAMTGPVTITAVVTDLAGNASTVTASRIFVGIPTP